MILRSPPAHFCKWRKLIRNVLRNCSTVFWMEHHFVSWTAHYLIDYSCIVWHWRHFVVLKLCCPVEGCDIWVAAPWAQKCLACSKETPWTLKMTHYAIHMPRTHQSFLSAITTNTQNKMQNLSAIFCFWGLQTQNSAPYSRDTVNWGSRNVELFWRRMVVSSPSSW